MIDKYLDLARELKKLQNIKTTVVPNIVGVLGMIPKVTGGIIDQKKDQNHTDHSIVEIG